MLIQLFFMLLDTACGLLSFALLVRFIMQWMRVSFRNPVGQFVIAVTDWMVRPLRRFVPALAGLDTSSLLLAWLWQALYLALFFGLNGIVHEVTLGAIGITALLALLETVKIGIYVVIAAVIVSAVFSWVNPYAPMAGLFNNVTQPMLRPFQRLIPLVGGVDLSPLALLLVLQVAQFLVNGLRLNLLPMLNA